MLKLSDEHHMVVMDAAAKAASFRAALAVVNAAISMLNSVEEIKNSERFCEAETGLNFLKFDLKRRAKKADENLSNAVERYCCCAWKLGAESRVSRKKEEGSVK